MVELISIIVVLCIMFLPSKIREWKSVNQLPPPGFHKDWDEAMKDMDTHGMNYYHEQNLKGKYYKKNEPGKFY